MRARTLILLVIALVLAGGTTMMARVWLAAQRQTPAEAAPLALQTPAKSVLVARSPIQRGQLLKSDDLVWEPWPEGGVDKNYVLMGSKTPDSYAGWVARFPISAGEPITETKIVAPGNRGFLAAVLSPGSRAVSVPVSATSAASGFIFPGDRVDLLITYSVQEVARPGQPNSGPQVDHKISETVLYDVRVIAIDQRLESKAGEAVVAHTATLEVTPKQSEVIALAGEMGKLSLSLRSLVPGPGEVTHEIDHAPSEALSSPLSATYTLDSDISPLLRNPFKAKERSTEPEQVTILRGAQSTTETLPTQPKPGG